MKFLFNALISLFLLGSPLRAEEVMGRWLTGPDGKGQVAEIGISRCDSGLCGRVLLTRNSTGRVIKGPNDGRRVLWEMTAEGPGTWRGKVLVPAFDATVNGTLLVRGNALTIKGCLALICKSQHWTRLE